jgi:transglutaminase-like putative cysteine protease
VRTLAACDHWRVQRNISSTLVLDITETSDMVASIAIAKMPGLAIEETLAVTLDGAPVEVSELLDMHGTRLHHLITGVGRLTIAYSATVEGRAEPIPVTELDALRYMRPSRYAESDALLRTAASEFPGLTGREALDAVVSWVSRHLAYVPGSSVQTDGAIATMLARQGVCRDYAHLTVGLLRALNVPARLVSVYAPGLTPMDFHAVAEALVDDQWLIVDATHLAPRESMLRVATGRDAADTAFLTTETGNPVLVDMRVTAVADALPLEDWSADIALG